MKDVRCLETHVAATHICSFQQLKRFFYFQEIIFFKGTSELLVTSRAIHPFSSFKSTVTFHSNIWNIFSLFAICSGTEEAKIESFNIYRVTPDPLSRLRHLPSQNLNKHGVTLET